MTNPANFPSLTGIARARAEELHWAVGIFGWAISKTRAIDARVVVRPSEQLLKARANSAAAISELLVDWQPAEPPN